MLPHVQRQPDRWCPLHSGRTRQNYYTPRPAPVVAEDYWREKPDPDGQIRDRSTEAERQQYLQDIADELRWVQSLTAAPHNRVLDLGCGRGWLLSALGDCQKWGVETSEEAANAARRHAEIIDGEWRWMFADEFFDVVVCHHVIEHLSDPIDHVHEMRRVLKRGGGLLMATPDFGSPCAKRFGAKYRMLHDETHISLFTLESMTRMLCDLGFTIEDVQFPFPERYATAETMSRWLDTSRVSPAWPGNWMTFYARRG